MADNVVTVNINVSGGTPDRAGFGRALFVTETPTNVVRLQGPFATEAEVIAGGYIAGTAPQVWASDVFAQDRAPDDVLIGEQLVGDAADWTVTMTAIEAAETDALQWYGANIESRTDTDILAVAAFIETRAHIFIPQSSDSDILTDGAGNIAEDLEVLNYNRTALFYHANDAEYLDGAMTGRGLGANLDTQNGNITWGNKKLSSVTFDDLSSAEVNAILANDANYFGRQKGLNFTRKGTMASGRRIDITVTNDWFSARLEEAVLNTIVNNPTKVPFTQAGIEMIRSTAMGVLLQGVLFGHFADGAISSITGKVTPNVDEIAIGNVSAADKTARTLTFTCEAVYSGAIETVVFEVNVSF